MTLSKIVMLLMMAVIVVKCSDVIIDKKVSLGIKAGVVGCIAGMIIIVASV